MNTELEICDPVLGIKTDEEVYNFIRDYDRTKPLTKKYLKNKFGITYSQLYRILDKLKRNHIIENHCYHRSIVFSGLGKNTTASDSGLLPIAEFEKLPRPESTGRTLNEGDQMYNYILSLDRTLQYKKNDIRKKLGIRNATSLSQQIRRLKAAGIIVSGRKEQWMRFKGYEFAPRTPVGYEFPPYQYVTPSIQNKIYQYIKALPRNFEYRKADILRIFDCIATNLTAVLNRLKNEMVIEDGRNSQFIKFTNEDPNDYFVIDEKKEREYKVKMEPYIRELARPLPEYLQP